jgi:hypothetical protein
MSDDLDGFAEWRDGIESRVGTLEASARTEARARAGMDQDMSNLNLKFDAQERLLKALSETQSEHTTRFIRVEAGLAGLDVRLARVEISQTRLEVRQESLEAGQAKVLAGVQTIIGLLDREIGNPPAK